MSEQIQVVLRGEDQASAAIQRADQSLVSLTRSSRDAALASAAMNQSLRETRAAADAMAAQIRALDPFQRTILHTVPIARGLAREAQGLATATVAVGTASALTSRRVAQLSFGAQALATSLAAGRVSAQGLVGALAALAPTGVVGVAVAAVAVLTAGLGLYATRAREARQEQEQLNARLDRFNDLSVQQLEAQRLLARAEQGVIRFARRTPTGFREATAEEARRLEELAATIQRIDLLLARRPAAGHFPVGSGGRTEDARRARAEAARERMDLEELYGTTPGLNRPLSAAEMAQRQYATAVAPMAREGLLSPEAQMAQDFAAGMDAMTASALAAADALTPVVDETLRLNEVLEAVGPLATHAFDALLGGLTTGQLSASAITRAILREVAREARAKAALEFAHGLAAAANPFKAPLAAGHFRAAAAYGAVAVVTGLGAVAAVGGAGGHADRGLTEDRGSFGRPSRAYTTIEQYVDETGQPRTGPRYTVAAPDVNITLQVLADGERVVAERVINRSAREEALGAVRPSHSRIERLAVSGLAVVAV